MLVGVGDGVLVRVGVGVMLGVRVDVLVAVAVGVQVEDGVGEGLLVSVRLGVAVCVGVLVGVRVGVLVAVGVAAGVLWHSIIGRKVAVSALATGADNRPTRSTTRMAHTLVRLTLLPPLGRHGSPVPPLRSRSLYSAGVAQLTTRRCPLPRVRWRVWVGIGHRRESTQYDLNTTVSCQPPLPLSSPSCPSQTNVVE